MKNSTLALSALTLALAAGLSACGGGTSSHTVSGVVHGLQYGPLVLTTNGMEIKVDLKPEQVGKPNEVAFSFPNQLEYGEAYNVTLKDTGKKDEAGNPIYEQPAHQYCAPVRGTADTAGRLSTINAEITCTLVTNTIGGTVSGYTGENLVLINGSTGGTFLVPKGATAFTFVNKVTYGQTYGVTVLTQPTGQNCTVVKGAGTMGDTPVADIAVTCRAAP